MMRGRQGLCAARATSASAAPIWTPATVGEVRTDDSPGTEDGRCLGFLLHRSISTATSTRVIDDTSSLAHCDTGEENNAG